MGPVGSVVYALVCTAVIVTMPYLFREAEPGRVKEPAEDEDNFVGYHVFVGGGDTGGGGRCRCGDSGGGCE